MNLGRCVIQPSSSVVPVTSCQRPMPSLRQNFSKPPSTTAHINVVPYCAPATAAATMSPAPSPVAATTMPGPQFFITSENFIALPVLVRLRPGGKLSYHASASSSFQGVCHALGTGTSQQQCR